jgi:hypothetical protein
VEWELAGRPLMAVAAGSVRDGFGEGKRSRRRWVSDSGALMAEWWRRRGAGRLGTAGRPAGGAAVGRKGATVGWG